MTYPEPAYQDWSLVGRSEELELIETRWRAGAAGILLSGGTGTGKSRLAREAAVRAGSAGAKLLSVVATRATSNIPYAALSELLADGQAEPRWLDVLGTLRALGNGSQPVILAIDDINHLDDLSMALVHRALSEKLLFLIATVRGGDDGAEDVVSLWKDLGVVRVDVQPLSRGQTANLVKVGLQGEVDGAALRDIWEITAGVPLYIRELILEAIRADALTLDSGVWIATGKLPPPGSLTDMIRRRITTLSDPARVGAEYLAIAERLDLPVLQAITDPAGIEDLERAGLAAMISEHSPIVRLTHPIIGEVVRQEMLGSRRLEIVDELASDLEQRGPASGEDLIRLASWRLETGDSDIGLFSSAALAAYRTGDFSLATRLATPAMDSGDVPASLLIAQMLHERGDHAEAEEMNKSLSRVVSEPSEIKRSAVQRSVNLFFGLGRGSDALEVLRSVTTDEMALNQAWILINMGSITHARDTVARADAADPLVWNVTSAWVEALGGRPELAIEHVAAAKALQSTEELPSRFRDFPEIPHVLALIAAGQLDLAHEIASHQIDVSVDRHPMFVRAWWHLLLGFIALDRGLLDDAATNFDLGAALQRQMNQPGLLAWYLAGGAVARFQQHDATVGQRLLAECESITGREEQLFSALYSEARAWQLACDGRRSEAIDLLTSGVSESVSQDCHWVTDRLVLTALRLGSVVNQERPAETGERAGIIDRLSEALQQNRGAELASTATVFAELGMALVAAEVWAQASLRYRSEGDQRAATQAANLSKGSLALCQRAQTPGLVAETTVSPLTDREREVLALAARGMPSKEIASTLDVSVRTINNQIQRAYTKLGVSSRAEAASALGLAGQPG